MSEFTGFGKDAIGFLKALGFHQSREWFHENKKLYESDVKMPLGEFIEAASGAFKKAQLPFHGSRKTSLFRINRDVRFSKNKDPYNTHVSGCLTESGTKKDIAGVYFCFQPDNCLFAAGLWQADGTQIKAMREAIIERADEFLALEAELKNKGLEFNTRRNLKRPAPGFKHIENPELIRLLHHRSFMVERHFDESEILSAKLVDKCVAFGQDVMALNSFIQRALGPLREENGNAQSS